MNNLNMIKYYLLKLPTPINISYWWNYGSLLGMFLMIQIISGLFMSMYYFSNVQIALTSMIHIIQNVSYGWLMHNIHMNSTSFLFICMYFHINRGIYYSSFNLTHTWMIKMSIFFTSMTTIFLGYMLPWEHMSFWKTTTITNLISTTPYIENSIVMWIWKSFSINNTTLNRFFSLHFILPFIILMMVILHLYFLHTTGSSNPLGLNKDLNKIPFHTYLSYKDFMGFISYMMLFTITISQYPYVFDDPNNFITNNPNMTPTYNKTEWYLLLTYTIWHSIPNKLGSMLALLTSIMILFLFPLLKTNFPSLTSPSHKKNNFYIMLSLILNYLTWMMNIMFNNFNLFSTPYNLLKSMNILYNLYPMQFNNISMIYSYSHMNVTIMSILYLLMYLFIIIKIYSIKLILYKKLNK